MENWEYKSLQWIHEEREDDYNKTKGLSAKELIEKTRRSTVDIARALRLKVAHTHVESTEMT